MLNAYANRRRALLAGKLQKDDVSAYFRDLQWPRERTRHREQCEQYERDGDRPKRVCPPKVNAAYGCVLLVVVASFEVY